MDGGAVGVDTGVVKGDGVGSKVEGVKGARVGTTDGAASNAGAWNEGSALGAA